jgi:hypothetical protein
LWDTLTKNHNLLWYWIQSSKIKKIDLKKKSQWAFQTNSKVVVTKRKVLNINGFGHFVWDRFYFTNKFEKKWDLTSFSLSKKSTYLAYQISYRKISEINVKAATKQNFAAFIFMGNFALKNP